MATEPGQSGGLPQLDFSTWPSQIFWLVVTLAVLFFIMKRIALPRIEETIEERDATITRDLDKASDLNGRAEEVEASYQKALADARDEARRAMEEAKGEAAARLKEALAEADERISAQVAESEARIGEIQANAAAQATEVAQSAASAIAERFSPSGVDASKLSAAVSERVSKTLGGTA